MKIIYYLSFTITHKYLRIFYKKVPKKKTVVLHCRRLDYTSLYLLDKGVKQ